MVEMLILAVGVFIGFFINEIRSKDGRYKAGSPCAILMSNGQYREAILLQDGSIKDRFMVAAWIYYSKGERKKSFPIAVDVRKIRFLSSEGEALNSASIKNLNSESGKEQ